MYCTKKISDKISWIGGNDRRLALFENIYPLTKGVSYNSYFIDDEKTVVFDTVDKSVSKVFFENIEFLLGGRKLDYLIISHMEPDHAAEIESLVARYPDIKIVCNDKMQKMMKQFFSFDIDSHTVIVKEGDTLSVGSHEFTFIMAPMVHWPEVMMAYEKTQKILFSADAFGSFGALDGHIFADEIDFDSEYLDESRRYYTNIVGKYGPQVQAVLKKASALDIRMICPLHGLVIRKQLSKYIDKYHKWSTYTAEQNGVLIAYASVYGNTENAAEIIAAKLADAGNRVVMHDVSVTHPSFIIADAFRFSHIVFVSTTYNAGIFVNMENLLHDLANHNLQNKTVAFVENGSWMPASGKLMKEIIDKCKNITYINNTVRIMSALKPEQIPEIDALVNEINQTLQTTLHTSDNAAKIDPVTLFKLTYGLFVLTAKDGDRDNGCIINTVTQVTNVPMRLSIVVDKLNYTHDIILETGVFNVSSLTESAKFEVFKHFGFQSGRDVNKFEDYRFADRSENGLLYITQNTNSFISAKVIDTVDYETHTVFIADITEAKVLSDEPSMTYSYYFENVKPKPDRDKKKGYVCKICGYIYEGDKLPPDYICPICKHGVEAFEPLA